jgi:hypothetical protein
MMLFPVILSTLALAATTLAAPLAAPSIIVKNSCKFDVYATSVGTTPRSTIKVQAGQSWTEAEYYSGTGTAIKITKTADGLYAGKPTLHLNYTYAKGKDIYYDLSSVYGYDFEGQNVIVTGDKGKDVPAIRWIGNKQASGTLYYGGETDLMLELCAA